MRLNGVASVLAATVLMAGCGSTSAGVCRCPRPVTYDDATLKRITAALKALPADNVLHRAMDDYEDERDDLRACLGIPN